MKAIIFILLVAASFASKAEEVVPYRGFRMTLAKTTILEIQHGVSKSAIESLKDDAWQDIVEVIGSGLFKAAFSIKKIKCTAATFDATKVGAESVTLANDAIAITRPGPAATITFGFEYNFQLLGFNLLFGTASITLTSAGWIQAQVFSARDISTSPSFTWSPAVAVISGTDLFKGITGWTIRLFSMKFYPSLLASLNKKINDLTLKTFDDWMNLRAPFYPDGSLNMTMHNSLASLVEAPVGHINWVYDTNVIVDNRPYNKKMWRYQKTVPTGAAYKGTFCTVINILSAMLETQSKARDFTFNILPASIGLKGKLYELSYIMPRLEEHFEENMNIFIGCRPINDNSIVMIKDPEENNLETRMQGSASCTIGVSPLGKDVVTVIFTVRGTVENAVDVDNGVGVIQGHIKDISIFDYKISGSMVPVEQPQMLQKIMTNIVNLAADKMIIPAGLYAKMPFTSQMAAPVVTTEEFCFRYK